MSDDDGGGMEEEFTAPWRGSGVLNTAEYRGASSSRI